MTLLCWCPELTICLRGPKQEVLVLVPGVLIITGLDAAVLKETKTLLWTGTWVDVANVCKVTLVCFPSLTHPFLIDTFFL